MSSMVMSLPAETVEDEQLLSEGLRGCFLLLLLRWCSLFLDFLGGPRGKWVSEALGWAGEVEGCSDWGRVDEM